MPNNQLKYLSKRRILLKDKELPEDSTLRATRPNEQQRLETNQNLASHFSRPR